MRPYRLSAVEQPLPADDLEGLRRVTAATTEQIIVDESLRTLAEAETLAQTRACDAFNIRVSKCGGLLRSARIARIAAENGLTCVVGAQVGESGILSAAGRHLAASLPAVRYLEGSAGRSAPEGRPHRRERSAGLGRARPPLRRPRPRRACSGKRLAQVWAGGSRCGSRARRDGGSAVNGTPTIQHLLRLWLKFSAANRFDDATWQPLAAQQARLLEIVQRNRDTVYGKAHDFGRVRSVADFQAAVPPNTYESLSPYIERMLEGDAKS